MTPVTLSTERLVLSTPTTSDIDRIAAYCQDPIFESNMATPWPYERRHAEAFVELIAPNGWASESEYTWAIREDQSGELLGMIGWRAERGDVGFWMGAPHRGRGYASEALASVCEWVFVERDIDRICWEAVAGNVESARVARAVGFRYLGEGAVRQPFRDGSYPHGWHGELHRGDDGSAKDGWPL
jgi:RimJ/RimL family protein N-acetyltransferase